MPDQIPDDLIDPVGKWDYKDRKNPDSYGKLQSYINAAAWLDELDTVEDWGCGLGHARQYFKHAKYTGVDGTKSDFCDVVDDLRTRESAPEGILLRHVLEHNICWQWILQNAIRCARKRICVVFFLRFMPRPLPMRDPNPGIYLGHMVEEDVENILCKWRIQKEDLSVPGYDDVIWYCERPNAEMPVHHD